MYEQLMVINGLCPHQQELSFVRDHACCGPPVSRTVLVKRRLGPALEAFFFDLYPSASVIRSQYLSESDMHVFENTNLIYGKRKKL
jgi:hypothetical protein